MLSDYLFKAASAWFIGFVPLAEIYVAVPAAVALGMDDISIIFWTVFGNFTPALLINVLYEQMMRIPRVKGWLDRLSSEKVQARMNRWGVWFILIALPWTGVWVMAVAAKALGMNSRRFLLYALIGIFVYATVILVLIRAGIASFA